MAQTIFFLETGNPFNCELVLYPQQRAAVLWLFYYLILQITADFPATHSFEFWDEFIRAIYLNFNSFQTENGSNRKHWIWVNDRIWLRSLAASSGDAHLKVVQIIHFSVSSVGTTQFCIFERSLIGPDGQVQVQVSALSASWHQSSSSVRSSSFMPLCLLNSFLASILHPINLLSNQRCFVTNKYQLWTAWKSAHMPIMARMEGGWNRTSMTTMEDTKTLCRSYFKKFVHLRSLVGTNAS